MTKKVGVSQAVRGTDDRTTLHRNDFIKYHGAQVGRIIHIFTVENAGILRVFFVLEQVRSSVGRDLILDLPFLQPTKATTIVGLPAVVGSKLYVIPLQDSALSGGGLTRTTIDFAGRLLWVDWNIQFL